MKWKISTSILLLVTLTVIGYSWKQNQSLTTSHDIPVTEQEMAYSVYQNDEYGYRFHYPEYFEVDEQRPWEVWLRNKTCYSNEGLCIPGVDSILISVSEKPAYETLDDLLALGSERNLITVNSLSLGSQEPSLKAIRYQFAEVPKQAKGGYSYELFNDGKLYRITFLLGDTTITAYQNDRLVNIAKDDYDPLGDEIMRTFEFVETD